MVLRVLWVRACFKLQALERWVKRMEEKSGA